MTTTTAATPRRAFLALAALTLTAFFAVGLATGLSARAEAPASEAVTEKTRLIAVRVYADWCPSCKILDQKVRDLRASFDPEEIAFLFLDYTARDAEDFYAQAARAGIEEPIRAATAERIKTGMMLLIDKDDNRVVGVINHRFKLEELEGALRATAAAS